VGIIFYDGKLETNSAVGRLPVILPEKREAGCVLGCQTGEKFW